METATHVGGDADVLRDAMAALVAGRFAVAEAAARNAIESAPELDPLRRHDVVVRAHELIARVHLSEGDLVRAADDVVHASEAALASDPVQRRGLTAISGVAAALVLSAMGDSDNALAELDRALPRVEKSHGAAHFARALLAYGHVMVEADRPAQARMWLHSAQRMAQLHEDPDIAAEAIVIEAASWHVSGQIAADHAEHDAAREAWHTGVQEAESALGELGRMPGDRRRHLAQIVRVRSLCLAALGREQEAYTGLLTARDVARDVLTAGEAVRIAHHVAPILIRRGQPDQVQAVLDLAIEQATMLPGRDVLVELLEMSAQLHEDHGRLEEALATYRRFHAVHWSWTAELWEARERIVLARQGSRSTPRSGDEERRSVSRRASRALPANVDRDPLTGLAVRSVLMRELSSALESAQASHESLSMALIGLDHVDRLREDHGDELTDQVLRAVAAIVVDACRGDDFVARADGYQLVAIFPNVNARIAAGIGERIRRSVETFSWAKLSDGLQASVSIGIADVSSHASAEQALARVGDLVMLAASSGHNRLCCEPLFPGVPTQRRDGED